ncbi:MAG: sodium:calcium antiporter [Candidatus Bathyarchaeota archaeon]
MFEELGVISNLLILIIAFFALNQTSNLTIKHSVRIAGATGLGKATVGFILVAFSTSLPELFVAIFAIMEPENVGISIGNVLGSNITNICLVLGIIFVLIALKYSGNAKFIPAMVKEETRGLHFALLVASVIPLALLYIGSARQIIGISLLLVFIYNIYRLSKTRNSIAGPSLEGENNKLKKYILMAVLGSAGVVASSFFIVETAPYLATAVGVPKVVIGATIVAIGTSLPELVTSIDSIKKDHADLALGNIVGSCFMNVTLILGVTLVAAPFSVEIAIFSKLIIFSLIANLFLSYFLSNEKIGWQEGAIFLFIYCLFLVTSVSGG